MSILSPTSLARAQVRQASAGHRRVAAIARRANMVLNGVDIGIDVRIGERLVIYHGFGLVVGNAVTIGNDCSLFQGVTLGTRNIQMARDGILPRSPTIGDNVTVYASAVVIGPITIGDRAVIGANAVVVGDVPQDFIVKSGIVFKG